MLVKAPHYRGKIDLKHISKPLLPFACAKLRDLCVKLYKIIEKHHIHNKFILLNFPTGRIAEMGVVKFSCIFIGNWKRFFNFVR